MSKILYDSTRVKPTRKPFALGLSRELPRRQRPQPSAADMAWWAQNSPTNTTGFEVIGPADYLVDAAAADALAQSRLDAGVVFC